jgi:hypothetical protein
VGTSNGSVDELRISDNARYSAATFAVPFFAFTDDANTEHLLHFDEASGLTANNSDTGANQDGTLNGEMYFVTPLYSGNSEDVTALDVVVSGGRPNLHMVTTDGWLEIIDLDGTSPNERNSDMSLTCNDVKAFHKDSATNNDVFFGLTSGLHLKRR